MSNRRNQKKSNGIIDSSNSGIVITETSIKLSDEKLNGMLLKTYEAAQKNDNDFKIYNLWSECITIAGTLFLALITSSFKKIGPLQANTVTIIAIVLCSSFCVCGIVLAIWMLKDKTSNSTNKRDKTVETIINEYLKNCNTK